MARIGPSYPGLRPGVLDTGTVRSFRAPADHDTRRRPTERNSVDGGVLATEMDQQLAAERAEEAAGDARNHRNGHSRKTVLTGTGKLDLQVPRDRQASFEPQLIAKYRRRFPDFDDKIVSLYARRMTVRDIQGHLRELYGIDVSPDLVSVVTDAVLEQVAEWQNRPLDALYPVVFFDALRVKIRDEGTVLNKAVYLALSVRPDGTKEVLGL